MIKRPKRPPPSAAAADLDILGTVEGCRRATRTLFSEIKARHGLDTARRLFRAMGPSPAQQRKLLDDLRLLVMIDVQLRLHPGATKQRIAGILVEHDRGRPREEWDDLDRAAEDAMRQQIMRVLDDPSGPDEALRERLARELETLRFRTI